MGLFGFGKRKREEKNSQNIASSEKKEISVIATEDKIDYAAAEEYFQKFESLAKEDNVEAFEYLQKAANLQHQEAVKRIIDLYERGHCRECIRRPALKVAAKEWQNPEKAVTYGLEAEKHGIDVAWDLMYAYLKIENYEQALHWAKISDSRSGKTKAVECLIEEMIKNYKNLSSEGIELITENWENLSNAQRIEVCLRKAEIFTERAKTAKTEIEKQTFINFRNAELNNAYIYKKLDEE
ncbi:MAG: hypothetical protein IKY30_07715 [Oscillospiraceae bacterium]|nr:hypothetical protein [Oscillospiraceae bacterium]